MPKRTNRFQKLVTLIETGLQLQQAKVYESRELKDRVTGDRREVDILIERSTGTHNFTIGVECTGFSDEKRGRNNPATVEWVERMLAKHRDLPTDKLVLVSEKGFTKGAAKKAAFYQATAYSMADAQRADWGSLFGKLPSMDIVTVFQPYDRKIDVFPSVPNPPEIKRSDLPNLIVHDAEGKSIAPLSNILNGLLLSPEMQQELEKQSTPNNTYDITLQYGFKTGSYLALEGGAKWPIASMKITAKYRREVSTIPLLHTQYGDAAVSHGVGEHLGQPIEIVATERPNEKSITIVTERVIPTSAQRHRDTGRDGSN